MTAPAAPSAWSAWTNVTPVIASRRESGLARLRLRPESIGPDADGNFPDVRIIDDADHTVPFAIDPQPATSETRYAQLIDTGFVPGRGTQGVVDLGPAHDLTNAIVITSDTNSRPTYFVDVDVDASDDRKIWREIRSGAIVYRVAEDDANGNQTIVFPQTRSRWIRLRVRDSHAALPLTSVRAARLQQQTESRPVPLLLAPSFALSLPSKAQVWTYDSPVAIRPSAVTFSASHQTYARQVAIATSDDARTWLPLATDSIDRYADGTTRTTFAIPERTTRHVRVTIENGDDAPLADVRPQLLTSPHDVVFGPTPHRRYRLLSGNPAAVNPAYDLGAQLAHAANTATIAQLGVTSAYAGYRDPRGLAERFPWLVTAAMGATAVVLAALALLTLRRGNEFKAECTLEPEYDAAKRP